MLSDQVKEEIRTAYSRIVETTPGFKKRGSQRKMIADVANGLANVSDEEELPEKYTAPVCVIEAPTGTGKTFAYLLAAIAVAKAKKKKLVLATATVALQSQLVEKDLPSLRKSSGYDFSFTLAKGRGRYACTSKLLQSVEEDSQTGFFLQKPAQSELTTLKKLSKSLQNNKWNGDLDDLDIPVSDGLWREITNDKFGCARQNCDHYNSCPFFKSRGAIHAVDVIVANHDLVLADLALGGGAVLPAPEQCIYIFDEAHHLSDKALRHFCETVPVQSTLAYLKSHVENVSALLSTLPSPTLQQSATQVAGWMNELAIELDELSNALQAQPQVSKIAEESFRWRFEQGKPPSWLSDLAAGMHPLAQKIFNSLETSQRQIEELGRKEIIPASTIENVQATIGPVQHRIEQIAALTLSYSQSNDNDSVPFARWVDVSNTQQRIEYTLQASPVWAAGILKRYLWSRCAGTLLTSATLTALGKFDDLFHRFGLYGRDEVTCSLLPSPFKLAEMATLTVPKMRAMPQEFEAHTKEIVKLLPGLLDKSKSALVLFSSKRQLESVNSQLPHKVKIAIKAQGEMAKHQIIAQHKSDIDKGKQSIILGLASFSEGVDLQGKYCEHVIIAKLDFAVPDDPIHKTLEEWLEKQGRSAFFDVSLPHCSRKLVQACGRLIRTESDKGDITLLDRRVVTKSYGKLLLDGLPKYRLVVEN